MLDILHPYNEVSGDISDEYLMEVIDIDGISENDVVLDLPLDTFESASLDLGWGNEDFKDEMTALVGEYSSSSFEKQNRILLRLQNHGGREGTAFKRGGWAICCRRTISTEEV